MTLRVKQIVTFAILMENGQGIVGKAPDYIIEKLGTAASCDCEEFLLGMLDQQNQAKYRQWKETWRIE